MAEVNGNGKFKGVWEFGPAFFAILAQTMGAAIAVTYVYGQLTSTTENTRELTKQLQHIIEKNDSRTTGINDRLITVETNMKFFGDTLVKISDKLDRINRQ